MPDKRINNTFQQIGHYKCICGREFEKAQSYNAHLSHCMERKKQMGRPLSDKRFRRIEREYICECGKVFKTNSSYVGHTSHCIYHQDDEMYWKNKQRTIDLITQYNKEHCGKDWYEVHTPESLKKQSETRIKRILSGEIKLPSVSNYGLQCIINVNSKQYMLRSSWELIYAIYLYVNNIDFEYETVIVKCIDNDCGYNNLICDFKINNKIIEIKGIASKKDYYIKESFENAGFEFEILYGDNIVKIKNALINDYKIDIDKFIELIKEHQTNLITINFNQFDNIVK